MSLHLRIFVLLIVLVYFVMLFYLLAKRSLNLKYTLLWIFSGIVMLVLGMFPQLLEMFSSFIGVQTPMNALFAVVLFCLVIILVSLTSIVSKQNDRTKQLIQATALMEHRLRALEEQISSGTTEE